MPKGEPLKPCPFCGSQPVVWALPMLTAMGQCTTFAVRCKCGANEAGLAFPMLLDCARELIARRKYEEDNP